MILITLLQEGYLTSYKQVGTIKTSNITVNNMHTQSHRD
jgi:hypothetical protein